jgi:hypothetical protein
MRNENWIDITLQKIERESILHLASDEIPAHEIAENLNISEKYVEEVIAEADAELVQEANRLCEHND